MDWRRARAEEQEGSVWTRQYDVTMATRVVVDSERLSDVCESEPLVDDDETESESPPVEGDRSSCLRSGLSPTECTDRVAPSGDTTLSAMSCPDGDWGVEDGR